MKKIIYVLTFLLSIISINVSAEDSFIKVRTDTQVHYLYGGEIKEIEGIRYDSLENTLILENYKSEGHTSIHITNMNDLKIKVVGENTINGSYYLCHDYRYKDFEVKNTNLDIFGDGTLNLYKGIFSEDEIKINVKDMTINVLEGYASAFKAENADINIKNVKINGNNRSSESWGVYGKNVTFENSSIKGTAGYACLRATDKLEVISSDVSCYAPYYGGDSLLSSGDLHIKDSNISIPGNGELDGGNIAAENNMNIENSNIEANIVGAYNTLSITKSEINIYELIGGIEMINVSKDTTINIDAADSEELNLDTGVITGKIINNYGKINIKNAMYGLTGTLVNNGELIMKDVVGGIYEGSIKYKDGYIRIDVMTKDKCVEKYGEDKCKHISPLLLTEKPEIPVEKLTGNITEVCPPEEGCYYISGTGEVNFESEYIYENFNFDKFIEIGKKEIPKEENNTITEVIKDVANTIGIINIIFITIGMLLVLTGIYILIRETKKRKN